jgi:phosphoribosylglycinamide formyltransferase 1
MNIAILASGNGSNAQRIADYFKGNKEISIALIASNNPEAFVLKRAETLKIPSIAFSKQQMNDNDFLLTILQKYKIDFIVLAGFMLMVPKKVIETYLNRIINIHPALLPKFGGKGMYGDNVHKAVIASGEKKSGITIHYVNEHYDEGAIIFQAQCDVLPEDTPDSLADRIHKLEHAYYPEIIEKTILGLLSKPTVVF